MSRAGSSEMPPPQPAPDSHSKPYWEHLARGELAIQRCQACREWQFPVLEFCRRCGGALGYEKLCGEGTIYSYLVQHHNVAPGFDALRPYAIALVTPDEAAHVRLAARIVEAAPDEVRIGQRVRVEIVDLAGGDYKLPVFALLADGASSDAVQGGDPPG
ncbi:MAG: OB-fold domain-containing protein [Deltaproteobacteria bacterium]|nr:OB-fold domain-containing protein [Deltaproteobacteria bacterium]MBW2362153.1 OB-fold domain-containing protein [Deltaproteobacteria bacterium]